MTYGSKQVTEKVKIKFQPSSTTFSHTKMHLIKILISPSDIHRISRIGYKQDIYRISEDVLWTSQGYWHFRPIRYPAE